MAIKVLIFDSVKELKEYEDNDFLEKKDIPKIEKVTKEDIEEGKPCIDLSPKNKKMFRKKWTGREKRQLKNILKESRLNGLNNNQAFKVAQKVLGRTFSSLQKMKYEMGIRYTDLKRPKKTIPEKAIPEKAEEPRPSQRRQWTNKDKVDLHKHLKECKKEGMSYQDAMESVSKQINRPKSSVIWNLSKMGVKYTKMKVHTPVFIATGKGKWSQAEDDFLVSETKEFCMAGKKIPKKLYKKFCKRLNRPFSSVRARVYVLKQEGRIAKIFPKERREQMTRNLSNVGRPKEEKKKKEGYMIKQRPTIMDRMKNFGKVSKEGNLFSNVLTNQQEDLLKGMIQNDIKIRGLSKITQEKLSLLMNLDGDDFEKFLIDVSKNAKKLKRYFKISVVSLNKDVSGQYIMFS